MSPLDLRAMFSSNVFVVAVVINCGHSDRRDAQHGSKCLALAGKSSQSHFPFSRLWAAVSTGSITPPLSYLSEKDRTGEMGWRRQEM